MNPTKILFLSGIVFALGVSGLFIGFMMNEPVQQHILLENRITVQVTGDANPGDASGFFYIMIYPHSATPATTYASNLSNVTAYEYSDSVNVSMTKETPYSTTFDIVIKNGVTNEDGQWTSNSTWNPDYFWCLLTCANLGIGADTNMSEQLIGTTSSTYAYYHYYLNNGGAGYTITEGQSFNITSVKFYVQRIG